MIYFAQIGGRRGPIKIGTSVNPPKRVREFACGSPYRVFLVGTLPGGRTEELALHRRFRSHRTHGEWFSVNDELVEFMKTCPDWQGLFPVNGGGRIYRPSRNRYSMLNPELPPRIRRQAALHGVTTDEALKVAITHGDARFWRGIGMMAVADACKVLGITLSDLAWFRKMAPSEQAWARL